MKFQPQRTNIIIIGWIVSFLLFSFIFHSLLYVNASSDEGVVTQQAINEPQVHIGSIEEKNTLRQLPNNDQVTHIVILVHCEVPDTLPSSVDILVEISANGGDWGTDSSETMIFNRAKRDNSFTSAFLIPKGAKPSDSREVVFTGNWRYSQGSKSGSTDTFQYPVEIIPTGYVTFGDDLSDIVVNENQKKDFHIDIKNIGSAEVRIRLEITTYSENIIVICQKNEINIPVNQIGSFNISVQNTDGKPGKFNFSIIIKNKDIPAYNSITKDYQGSIQERKESIPNINVLFLIPLIILEIVIDILVFKFIVKRIRKRKERKNEDQMQNRFEAIEV